MKNRAVHRNGRLCWDMDRLFEEVLQGLEACREQGFSPASVGIDTWAVDFVLLDRNGDPLGDAVAYRDSRTRGMDRLVEERIPFQELYRRTGIQKQEFNTIYQLMAVKQQEPQLLERAQRRLMVPEYLTYRLTGKMENEYTNATTTGLVNAPDQDLGWGASGPAGLSPPPVRRAAPARLLCGGICPAGAGAPGLRLQGAASRHPRHRLPPF